MWRGCWQLTGFPCAAFALQVLAWPRAQPVGSALQLPTGDDEVPCGLQTWAF